MPGGWPDFNRSLRWPTGQWLLLAGTPNGRWRPRPDTCCVYTEETRTDNGARVEIGIGDSFWWQGGRCYWTPKANRTKPGARGGVDCDIPLPKIGFSH